MVTLKSGDAQETFVKDEDTYTTSFLKWKGLVDENPVLRSIIDIRAASLVSSWRIEGEDETKVNRCVDIFDGMQGRGNETFKLMMHNAYEIAYVGGDAYAEIIFDKVRGLKGDVPVDLETLPSDNIRQKIKQGRIIKFEEIDGKASWKPEQILHLPYGKLGAMTHGMSKIESMNNLLISYKQMMQSMTEVWENTIKPREVIFTNSDNTTKNRTIADAFLDADKSFRGKIFLPSGLVTDYKVVTARPGIDPVLSIKAYRDEMFMATQTPEILLGTGYSTSEEDARTRIAGFRGSIRFDQKWLEEHLFSQLIKKIYAEKTPQVKFSYATESQDEKFNRMLQASQTIGALPINEQSKIKLIGDTLEDAGLLK